MISVFNELKILLILVQFREINQCTKYYDPKAERLQCLSNYVRCDLFTDHSNELSESQVAFRGGHGISGKNKTVRFTFDLTRMCGLLKRGAGALASASAAYCALVLLSTQSLSCRRADRASPFPMEKGNQRGVQQRSRGGDGGTQGFVHAKSRA